MADEESKERKNPTFAEFRRFVKAVVSVPREEIVAAKMTGERKQKPVVSPTLQVGKRRKTGS